MMKRWVSIIILGAFLANAILPGYAQGVVNGSGMALPAPGTMVALSPSFVPPLLKGIKVDPRQPYKFDFVLSAGSGAEASDPAYLRAEALKLIRYFLASFTIPEDDLWVNLSPYEKDRIVPDAFAITEMGRDLLAQDYVLKQITASLIYPEGDTGKAFWEEVYKKAQARFGTSDIPTDVFNKVWIVPHEAEVYEDGARAVVVKATLKVMLEKDYLAMENNGVGADLVSARGRAETSWAVTHDVAKEVLREVIIPVLEKEVNEGQNFAQLRQVYHSLILAKWYKQALKKSILSRAYADQRKIKGLEIPDTKAREKIYAQYVEAFKKGVFNYIREEYDAATDETIPRKYFSGGVGFKFDMAMTHDMASVVEDGYPDVHVTGDFKALDGKASLASERPAPPATGIRARPADEIMAELDGTGKFLWDLVSDVPHVRAKVRARIEALVEDNVFLGSVQGYLEKMVRKGKYGLTAADVASPALVLVGSYLLYAAARDIDLIVFVKGDVLRQKKVDLPTSRGIVTVDLKVIGSDFIARNRDVVLSDGATFAGNVQYLIEKAGIVVAGDLPQLELPLLSPGQKAEKARVLMGMGATELRLFMADPDMASPYKGTYRFLEAYHAVRDLLIENGIGELSVGNREPRETLRDFYLRFLRWGERQDTDDGDQDNVRMWSVEGLALADAVREKLDLLDDMAQGVDDDVALDARKIIRMINGWGRELIRVDPQDGEEAPQVLSLVAVPAGSSDEGADMVNVFLRRSDGVMSVEPAFFFEVDHARGMINEFDVDLSKAMFHGDDAPLDLRSAGITSGFIRVLSGAVGDGAGLHAYIYHEPTRRWLDETFEMIDGRVFFHDEQGGRLEVVDDRVDPWGRLERQGLYPYQILVSDILARSPAGFIWTVKSGFRRMSLTVQNAVEVRSGLAALQWWIREAKKPADAPDKVYLQPFFTATQESIWVSAPARLVRDLLAPHQQAIERLMGSGIEAMDRAVLWFLPYAGLPRSELGAMMHKAFTSVMVQNPEGSFGLKGSEDGDVSETEVMQGAVDRLVKDGEPELAVSIYGGGGFLARGTSWNAGDTEIESLIKALMAADMRYGRVTDIALTIYDHSLALLSEYPRQVHDLEAALKARHPEWKGRIRLEARYADLLQAARDERVAALIAVPSHITFWRHTWIGDAYQASVETGSATAAQMRALAARFEAAISRGALIVRESDGRAFLNIRKLIGFDQSQRTEMDAARASSLKDMLSPLDIHQELQAFAASWTQANGGSGKKMVDLMMGHSKGVGTIYDFVRFWKALRGERLGARGLGLWTRHFDAFSRMLGIVHFNDGYKDYEITRKVDGEHLDDYLEKITATDSPIVFFVPRKAFTYNDFLDHFNGIEATRRELEWLLRRPEKMKNVYFVFGAYDALPDERLRDHVVHDVGATYARIISKAFADPQAYASLLSPDRGPGMPGHFEPLDIPEKTAERLMQQELRRIVARHFPASGQVGAVKLPPMDEVMAWFTPYAGLPENALDKVVRKAMKSVFEHKQWHNFELESGDGVAEWQTLVNGVDGLIRKGVKDVIVTTYGGGEYLSTSGMEKKEPSEFDLALKAVAAADARHGTTTDLTFVVYERDVELLSRYAAQLEGLKKTALELYPQWHGRISHRVHYGDVTDAVVDAPVGRAMATPSNITFWRHSWVAYRNFANKYPVILSPDEFERFIALLEGAVKPGALIVQEWTSADEPPVLVQKLIGLDHSEKVTPAAAITIPTGFEPAVTMHGKTVLRFSHSMVQTGGVQVYLSELDRTLLQRNQMTIIELFYTKDETLRRSETKLGQGALIQVPVFFDRRVEVRKEDSLRGYVAKAVRGFGLRSFVKYVMGLNGLAPVLRRLPVVRRQYQRMYYPTLELARQLEDLFNERRIDLVVNHVPFMFSEGMTIDRLSAAHGVPLVLQNHGTNRALKSGMSTYSLSKAVTGVATVNSVDIPRAMMSRATTLWDGVDADFWSADKVFPDELNALRKELGLGVDDKVVVLPARVVRGKGHADMIRIGAWLKAQGQKLKIVFAGDFQEDGAYYQALSRSLSQSGLSGMVLFTGNYEKTKLRALYALSDIIVLPSESEGLPRILMEAGAMKKPVIAYANDGIQESILHGRTGYLVKDGDLKRFAFYLRGLLADAPRALAMGEAARDLIAREFSLSVLAERTEKYYARMITHQVPTRANAHAEKAATHRAGSLKPLPWQPEAVLDFAEGTDPPVQQMERIGAWINEKRLARARSGQKAPIVICLDGPAGKAKALLARTIVQGLLAEKGVWLFDGQDSALWQKIMARHGIKYYDENLIPPEQMLNWDAFIGPDDGIVIVDAGKFGVPYGRQASDDLLLIRVLSEKTAALAESAYRRDEQTAGVFKHVVAIDQDQEVSPEALEAAFDKGYDLSLRRTFFSQAAFFSDAVERGAFDVVTGMAGRMRAIYPELFYEVVEKEIFWAIGRKDMQGRKVDMELVSIAAFPPNRFASFCERILDSGASLEDGRIETFFDDIIYRPGIPSYMRKIAERYKAAVLDEIVRQGLVDARDEELRPLVEALETAARSARPGEALGWFDGEHPWIVRAIERLLDKRARQGWDAWRNDLLTRDFLVNVLIICAHLDMPRAVNVLSAEAARQVLDPLRLLAKHKYLAGEPRSPWDFPDFMRQLETLKAACEREMAREPDDAMEQRTEDNAEKREPVHKVILKSGGILLSSVSLLSLEGMRKSDRVVEVFRDPEEGFIDTRPIDPDEDEDWKTFSGTSVEKIGNRLGLDMEMFIRKAKSNPGQTFTWVDWGCGDGTAIDELARRLDAEGVVNVRLYAFANAYSPAWESLDPRITFILDVQENFFKYFEKGTISLIYSHLGMVHIKPASELLAYVNRLADHVASGGEVFTHAWQFLTDDLSSAWKLERTPDDYDVVHLTRTDDAATGGIDLKAGRIDLQTTGPGARLDLPEITDAAQMENIQGFIPVVNSITPISGLREFAGMPSS